MSNVIQFPQKDIRNEMEIEKIIREILRQNGASEKMEEFICKKMKEVVHKYNKNFTINMNLSFPQSASDKEIQKLQNEINQEIQCLSQKFQDLMSEVFYDRLILEIELYKAYFES